MDDLLALFDAAPEEPEDLTNEIDARRDSGGNDDDDDDDHDDSERRRGVDRRPGASSSMEQRQAASADAKIGIRMINRGVSGANLLELLMEHPYHSPAALCAKSLDGLRALLIDPTPSTDSASSSSAPCGRMHLITVGLVFSNSGTRMAASGNAFCVLTMGNLASGPAITCMLFGAAYSHNCRRCQPGKVVALLGPRLLPPKESSSSSRNDASTTTAVSFSVNDERQIVLVADALDYGTCPAPVRGKNEEGHWVHDAKRCGHYVDKRVGEYCPKHRKLMQQHMAIPATRATGRDGKAGTSATAMQKLRQEATLFPKLDPTKRISIPGNRVGGTSMGHTVPLQPQVSGPSVPRSQQMMAQFQNQLASGTIDSRVTTALPARTSGSRSNRLLHPNTSASGTSIGAAAAPLQNAPPMRPVTQLTQPPPHITAAASSNPIAAAWRPSTQRPSDDPRRLQNTILNPKSRDLLANASTTDSVNPYLKAPPSVRPTPIHQVVTTSTLPSPRSTPAPSDWMQRPENKRKPPSASRLVGSQTTQSKKRRPVQNADTTHFNGSVPIPQPKSLRLSSLHRPTAAVASTSALLPPVAQDEQRDRRAQELLERQSAVAAQLRTCKGGGRGGGGGGVAKAKTASTTLPGKPRPFLLKHGPRRVTAAPPEPSDSSGTAQNKESENQDDRTQHFSLFGPLSDSEREAIRSAKSLFADEAAAEEYALKRHRMVELERNEEFKGAKNDASGAAQDTLIRKEWFCRTCHRTFQAAPHACQRSNHPVVVRRTIQESTNLDERRQALSDLQADDGGLKLGAGLEWSKWNRFG